MSPEVNTDDVHATLDCRVCLKGARAPLSAAMFHSTKSRERNRHVDYSRTI